MFNKFKDKKKMEDEELKVNEDVLKISELSQQLGRIQLEHTQTAEKLRVLEKMYADVESKMKPLMDKYKEEKKDA